MQKNMLLDSQSGPNAPDSTLDIDFSLWFIHTCSLFWKSDTGNITLDHYFSDFIVSLQRATMLELQALY